MHVYDPRTWEVEREDQEFRASLTYSVSLRLLWIDPTSDKQVWYLTPEFQDLWDRKDYSEFNASQC